MNKNGKINLSQWHDGSVKPVHAGVYEIKRENIKRLYRNTMFSFFDGLVWRGWKAKSDFELGYYPNSSDFIVYGQDRQWRGIVKGKK